MKLSEICAEVLNTEMTGFLNPKYDISEKDGKITYRFYADMTVNVEDVLKASDIYSAIQRHLFDTSKIGYVRGLHAEIKQLEKYKNHYELELEKLKCTKVSSKSILERVLDHFDASPVAKRAILAL